MMWAQNYLLFILSFFCTTSFVGLGYSIITHLKTQIKCNKQELKTNEQSKNKTTRVEMNLANQLLQISNFIDTSLLKKEVHEYKSILSN
ncbi:MAG: hypothetical protein UR26_C0001G0042 [candidate division TM6 bacterium GW2011_GWF2_32_72]|nr:MAG: hypothetical protein UR26_C0001G0042 [candidate division TM6 bacterium GW2011_GWF2_32_72]